MNRNRMKVSCARCWLAGDILFAPIADSHGHHYLYLQNKVLHEKQNIYAWPLQARPDSGMTSM
jgi:hypothetical protein